MIFLFQGLNGAARLIVSLLFVFSSRILLMLYLYLFYGAVICRSTHSTVVFSLQPRLVFYDDTLPCPVPSSLALSRALLPWTILIYWAVPIHLSQPLISSTVPQAQHCHRPFIIFSQNILCYPSFLIPSLRIPYDPIWSHPILHHFILSHPITFHLTYVLSDIRGYNQRRGVNSFVLRSDARQRVRRHCGAYWSHHCVYGQQPSRQKSTAGDSEHRVHHNCDQWSYERERDKEAAWGYKWRVLPHLSKSPVRSPDHWDIHNSYLRPHCSPWCRRIIKREI